MWFIKRQITETLDRFSDSERQRIFEYLIVLKQVDQPSGLGQPQPLDGATYRQTKVAGKLATLNRSNRTFQLITAKPSAVLIEGIIKGTDLHLLPTLLGKEVLVSGTAYFAQDNKIVRLEAEQIGLANINDLRLWSKVPTPLFRQFQSSEYQVAQDSSSGMSAILGKWPGEESDQEIAEALEQLS